MSTLRKFAIVTIAASAMAFVTAAHGEPATTPKHVDGGQSWLPRDHLKIEKGRVEIDVGEGRRETAEKTPRVSRNLDARILIPGAACSGTAVAFDITTRGVRTCLTAYVGRTARPDWIAVAIAAVTRPRAYSLDAPLTS